MHRSFLHRLAAPSAPSAPSSTSITHRCTVTSRRTLTSSRPRRHPTATNAPARPDHLERIANRPLPSLSQLSNSRRWLTTIPIFIAILTGSALGIFNYQKVSSPIIAALLYSLRTNATVREELGDEVYFADQFAWVWGTINLVQGRVDVSFRVKGTKGKGMCNFKARRTGSRAEMFKTQEWSLAMDDGRVIHLLEDEARQPLEGAAF